GHRGRCCPANADDTGHDSGANRLALIAVCDYHVRFIVGRSRYVEFSIVGREQAKRSFRRVAKTKISVAEVTSLDGRHVADVWMSPRRNSQYASQLPV
ncbi:MAG: hypothetical protein QGG09_08920, partial [Pirellulaceae bacterium]|nr:hypothetical protein [Pirellulaceae bacterium]